MNRDIIVLREVVQKLVPLLAGRGLTVTQRGSQAYVLTNPTTKQPETINIPNISDNAKPDFIRAIQGFIDHEVAHVLITDWNHYGRGANAKDLKDPKVRRFMNTHNIVEDTMIEREIVKIFPGSARNISDTRKYFLERITAEALKGAKDDKEAFVYLLVPAMRALAGHEEMQEFMDKGGYWKNKFVDEMVKAMKPATLKLLRNCTSTKETLQIAEEVDKILYPTDEGGEPEPDGEDEDEKKSKGKKDNKPKNGKSSKGKSKKSKDKDEDDADTDGEDSSGSTSDEEGEDEGDGDDGSGEESEDGDEEGAGAGQGEDDGDGDEDGSSSSSGGDDGEEGEEEGAGGSKPSANDEGEGGEPGKREKSPFRTEGADGGGVGNIDVDIEDEDDAGAGGGGGVGNEAARSIFQFESDAFDEADMSSQIAIKISDEAVAAMDPHQYKVFTREIDQIEPVNVPGKIEDSWVPKMEDEVRAMTGRMQKDIERIMASQSHIIRTPGHKNGKLHAPSLYRLTNNDPRVFSQRQEHRSKDTAVMLLADNSGSMGGEKMRLGMIASYALSVTLDRVKIAHEVLGFTTGNFYNTPTSIRQAMEEDIDKSGIRYDRVEPIIMPIYKAFEERITAIVKARFAYMMFAQRGLNGNIDGESLEYAAERLLKRPEKRKVMLVLSDGQPAGSHKAGPHLSYVVKNLEKTGIECIGIGIMDDSVKRFYPNYVVLKKASELPNEVMTEIKRLLA